MSMYICVYIYIYYTWYLVCEHDRTTHLRLTGNAIKHWLLVGELNVINTRTRTKQGRIR